MRALVLLSMSLISACAPMGAPKTNEEVVIECHPLDRCCLPPPYRLYGCMSGNHYAI